MLCKTVCPWLVASGLLCVTLAGCSSKTEEYKTFEEAGAPATEEHHHDHDAPGPHGGNLAVLGNEEYHAEVVIDHDAHKIIVYLLGADAKTAHPIEAAELTLEAEGQTHTLAAAPLDGEPAGQSSRFELENDDLMHEILEAGELEGKLTVKVGEQTYQPALDIHLEEVEHEHKE